MICTLIRSAEINDRISRIMERYLRRPIAAYNQPFIDEIAKASYNLGTLTMSDTRNFHVYAGMVEVLQKIRERL